MDQEQQDQYQQEINQLKEQLQETTHAETFFELGSGKLFVQIANKKINKIIADITSDKYIKDHTGYVNAVAELNAYRNMLKSMQAAKSPVRIQKIKEKLDGYGDLAK